MNLPMTGKINNAGHLDLGGCDAVELIRMYGSPLYVIDEHDVRERCRQYIKLFRAKYMNSEIIYASKALCAKAILQIISEEGLGVDVSSGGELFTALSASFNPKKIYFHGNNKSKQEIEEGLKASVGRFVIDNFNEIEMLDSLCGKARKRADVLVRVNPGVEAHTHEAIRTGQTDSKFGISKDNVLEAVNKIDGSKNLNYKGLHAHIGSQIFDVDGYLSEIEVLTDLAKQLMDQKLDVGELNIGGGLGIKYVEGDDPVGMEVFADAVVKKIKERIASLKLTPMKLILEPGRSIIGTAGVTLYTVGHVKEIPGVRKYVVIDGGMADNPRPMLYGSRYEFAAADNMKETNKEKVTIAGRFCESGDVLAKDVDLPAVKTGSVIAVMCTGAYNYSMSSNYNRVTRPAMVIVKDGRSRVIVKRESYEGMTSCDAS